MKLLENSFSRLGREFLNVYCDEKYRIWKVSLSCGTEFWYECHIRKFQKESKMKNPVTRIDIIFPEKEKFPSDEDFGKWAWTYKTLDQCMEKLTRSSES